MNIERELIDLLNEPKAEFSYSIEDVRALIEQMDGAAWENLLGNIADKDDNWIYNLVTACGGVTPLDHVASVTGEKLVLLKKRLQTLPEKRLINIKYIFDCV